MNKAHLVNAVQYSELYPNFEIPPHEDRFSLRPRDVEMKVLQRHESPDGLLCLLVGNANGDTCIGFDGFAWHTHGDILASISGLPETEAVSAFVSEIVGGQRVIAVSRVAGTIRDVWVSDDPSDDLKYKPEDETIEYRYWDGTHVAV